MSAARKAVRAEVDISRTDQAYWDAVLKDAACEFCGAWIVTGKRGPKPRYCTDAHRKAAKKQRDAEPERVPGWEGLTITVGERAPWDHDGPGGRYRKPQSWTPEDAAVLEFLSGFTTTERIQGYAPLATGYTSRNRLTVIAAS